MIVDKSNIDIECSGIQSEGFFNVSEENLPWLFSILRSSLYSDKPLAILREYSTNALDAHVVAGTPERPFLVWLPNHLSPNLVIRDFGPGLSEDDIYNVFASYGMSTKRDTNEQIGSFGVGCKSGFCYADSFTVTSYYNGTKSTYEAYIDETNLGKISKLASVDTHEENGLEISITVKPKDFNAFIETAKKLFFDFEVRPIIINNTSVKDYLEFFTEDYIFNTDKWFLSEGKSVIYDLSKDYHSMKLPSWVSLSLFCSVSNVHYRVDLEKLTESQKERLKVIKGVNLVLKVPIGAVKISANREALEYDTNTINYLIKAINDFEKDLDYLYEKLVNNANTLWEARLNFTKFMDLRRFSLTWKNIEYNPFIINFRFPLYIKAVRKNSRLKKLETLNANEIKSLIYTTCNKNSIKVLPKLKQDLEEKNAQNFILGKFDSKEDLDQFLNHPDFVGCVTIDLDAIELKSKPKLNNIYKSPKKFVDSKAFLFKSTNSKKRSEFWGPIDVDIENGEGIYVYIHSFLPVGIDKVKNMEDFKTLLSILSKITNETVPIIGFRSKVETPGSKWVHLVDYLEEYFKKLSLKNEFKNAVLKGYLRRYLNHMEWVYLNPMLDEFRENPNSYIGNFLRNPYLNGMDTYEYKLSTCYDKLKNYTPALSEYCNNYLKDEKEKLILMSDDIKSKYPMLELASITLRGYGLSDSEPHLALYKDYIKSIESSNP